MLLGDRQTDDDMSHPLYRNLKENFDAVFNKYLIDNQFRDSVEKYLLELKSKLQSPVILPNTTKAISEEISQFDAAVSSEPMDPHNGLHSLEQKNLEGLSLEQVTAEYRILENQHAKSLKTYKNLHDR